MYDMFVNNYYTNFNKYIFNKNKDWIEFDEFDMERYGFEEGQKMQERLQELKEKITSFVRDYDIEEFDIWIEEDGNADKKVTIEIRV